ncbi:MAG: ERF family protein, partial [Chlorobium sp.]|nr:ERF family protein [Chlorobium sp.]
VMLAKIQAEIKAPKSQRNDFGKYNYRSMEDINESVKPILAKYDLAFVVSDELVMVGNRFYIKATASLVKEDGTIIASSTGYAREEETKKGMDASQITGSCSSYARKYAANGLFAIDDTKDADHGDNREEKKVVPTSKQPAGPTPRPPFQNPMPEITEDQLICVADWKKKVLEASKATTSGEFYSWLKANGDNIHKECGATGKAIVADFCKPLMKKAA